MVQTLDPAKFNALLAADGIGLGQKVTWARAFACPCRSPTSGAAEQGCPVCQGRGVAWDQPIAAWTGLAGMKIAREWAMFGEWESGDVVVTIPSDSPLYGAGENDRVTFINSTEAFSSILMGGVDHLPFQATEINRLVWRDPVTKALTVGGIPSEAPDGTLTWTSGAPPAGVQYSISGRRNPEYWLFKDLVQDRHHHAGRALPRRVALRRFDLFGKRV